MKQWLKCPICGILYPYDSESIPDIRLKQYCEWQTHIYDKHNLNPSQYNYKEYLGGIKID